jgi:predicted pyridoxine 5'-phosphate oxidase superfamily flavin-nucleotide-binding protein
MDTNPVYHAGMRAMQDLRDTRRIADRLAEVTLRSRFTEEDRAFIERSRMFFLATADDTGAPDCSYKGGVPGFVHVADDHTLEIPDYDGNGMYRSWGNVGVNPKVGLLFIDFETPKRLRVNGNARISRDPGVLAAHEGAVLVVQVTAERIFPNCPRYIHRMQHAEESAYSPRPGYVPPVPAWKTYEVFRDALPARDQAKP